MDTTHAPAEFLVLGAGVAGLQAMGTARRLGAVVTGYDIRPETGSPSGVAAGAGFRRPRRCDRP